MRIKLHKCRIVFFDLEFYVPEELRNNKGFVYNPWDKRCKLIGGTFFTANPIRDFERKSDYVRKKSKSFWLWKNNNNERQLVENITIYLRSAYNLVINAHDGAVSPVLTGINITSSDVPAIFELIKRYKILSNQEAFALQNRFRIVDLSSVSIPAFNNSTFFLYPKTKNNILNKYYNGEKFESGKSVWDMFDNREFSGIEDRVLKEIIASFICYKNMKKDFDKFKELEKIQKKREKIQIGSKKEP